MLVKGRKQSVTTFLGSLIMVAHGVDPDEVIDLIEETSGAARLIVRFKPDAQNASLSIVLPSRDEQVGKLAT